MKWYNVRTYVAHKADIESMRDELLKKYVEHVHVVARSFPKDSMAIGCLDLNDLTQSGYVGLVQAWEKVDWDMINAAENPDGTLWSFLKKRIKWQIKRDIDKYSRSMAMPINRLERARMAQTFEDILITSFPKFFDHELLYTPDEGPWQAIQLEKIITDELSRVEPVADNREMLLSFFGIGTDKLSTKELGIKYRKNPNAISQTINNVKKKLKNEYFEKIIENFYKI